MENSSLEGYIYNCSTHLILQTYILGKLPTMKKRNMHAKLCFYVPYHNMVEIAVFYRVANFIKERKIVIIHLETSVGSVGIRIVLGKVILVHV